MVIAPHHANLFATDGLAYEIVELTAFPSEPRTTEAGKLDSAPKEKVQTKLFHCHFNV